ncbi:hypothetical protein F511_41219 [Dorcoceras hygrometricum]|uniref:Uncharacterized protein n=1 Tax=Dorcoceras hygrometricum TaxID=472368 RepID=A0A2Z7ABB2_9LAMI|nr:hypothetical protein F511_41219 [Dorcoceras hygrometricum]
MRFRRAKRMNLAKKRHMSRRSGESYSLDRFGGDSTGLMQKYASSSQTLHISYLVSQPDYEPATEASGMKRNVAAQQQAETKH